jgi:hypothetical protein
VLCATVFIEEIDYSIEAGRITIKHPGAETSKMRHNSYHWYLCPDIKHDNMGLYLCQESKIG